MIAAEATRDVFQNLAHWQIVVWYCLAGVSTVIFAAGVLLLVRKYLAGRAGRSGESTALSGVYAG